MNAPMTSSCSVDNESLFKTFIAGICLFAVIKPGNLTQSCSQLTLAHHVPHPARVATADADQECNLLFGRVRRAILDLGENMVIESPTRQGAKSIQVTVDKVALVAFGNFSLPMEGRVFAEHLWRVVCRLSNKQVVEYGEWALMPFLKASACTTRMILDTTIAQVLVHKRHTMTSESTPSAHASLPLPSTSLAETVVLDTSTLEPTVELSDTAMHVDVTDDFGKYPNTPMPDYITVPSPDHEAATRRHMTVMVEQWDAYAASAVGLRIVQAALDLYIRLYLSEYQLRYPAALVAAACVYVALCGQGHMVVMSDFGEAIGIPATCFFWVFAAMRDQFPRQCNFSNGCDVSLSVLPSASLLAFAHDPSRIISDAVTLASLLRRFLIFTRTTGAVNPLVDSTRTTHRGYAHLERRWLSNVDGVASLLVSAHAHGYQSIQIVDVVHNGQDFSDGSFGEAVARALRRLAASPLGRCLALSPSWSEVVARHQQQVPSEGLVADLVGSVRGWLGWAGSVPEDSVAAFAGELVREWEHVKKRVPLTWQWMKEAELAGAPEALVRLSAAAVRETQ